MAGPSLELDWELGLFKALRALWRLASPEPPEPFDPQTVALAEPLLGRLGTFASIIAGQQVRVEAVRGPGGIRQLTILVPHALDIAPDAELNRSLYLVRVAVDAATIRRGFREVGAEQTLSAAWRSIDALSAELPRFRRAFREAGALVGAACPPPEDHPDHAAIHSLWRAEQHDGPWSGQFFDGVLWGRLLEVALPEVGGDAGESPPSAEASESETHEVLDVRVLSLDEEEVFEAPLHSFEKIELAEQFNGHLRQLDGDDELDAHLDALGEVDLSALIRGGPQAHSLIRADIALEAEIPDAADIHADETAVYYPEWDRARRRYRQDWCAVYPTPLPRMPPLGLAEESLRRQRRSLEKLRELFVLERQQRRRRPRVIDGDELDLDAAIDAEIERRAQRTPSLRVDARRERRLREVATTVLVDISLSADSWVDGRRVWDVTRDALWVFGQAAAEAGDALQILAFASHTRHRVRVYTVLDWHEPWALGMRRLERLQPQGYTRIGPAIRHGIASLRTRAATRRQLILLSDCKPTDYDRYEGRHGIGDVRRALDEARQQGIVPFGIAIDDTASSRLPGMFGPGSWSLLSEPEDLGRAVGLMHRSRRI
ncbi:MAG: VWA domain-containing protein [Deltaproteobacteria bacterium]|nr:MAG: VWA domain-containing protein [Deltaproteobacteria bacterium]